MKFIKLILLIMLPVIGFGQTLKIGSEVTVVHFNAGWNSAADVKWVKGLEECKIKYCDIATDTKAQNKYEIVVVPTIIIFKGGIKETVFKAGLDLELPADLEEIQEAINEVNTASKF